MSYFYGTPITSSDSQSKKKHRRKVTTNDLELEQVHDCRQRRKHPSKTRSTKSKLFVTTNETNDETISSPKSKYKKHKEVDKLLTDNEKLISKLETTPESGFIEELSEKENKLIKYRNRCSKLEKSYQENESEKVKLEKQLAKRENDFIELNFHYEELVKLVKSFEQEKSTHLIELKKLKTENLQLNEDVSLLKVLIYKLNVEIERYQDKLRQINQQIDVDDKNVNQATENKKVFESWGNVNSHVLAPLLDAYHENIEEKENLIKQYRHEIDHFGGRCKDIVAENNEYRKKVDEYKSELEKMSTEMTMILEDANLVKEENSLLSRQQAIHQQKLHEIHSVYEKKVELMSQDNNKLHTNYMNCKTELSNIQGKYEILNEGYEKLKKNSDKTMPVSVHNQAIEECKSLFEELKNQYDTEKKKLVSQLKKYEEINPDYERQLLTLTTEKDQLKQQIKNLEKNLKHTQNKLKYFQNLISSIQVSRDSFKRQLSKTTSYCEELVIEQEKLITEKNKLMTLLEKREKENVNIQNLGDNIVQRMGTLKTQLKNVQKGAKEQLETVEKHMKCQENDVGKIKLDHHHELQRLKKLLKQKEDVIGKLQREKLTTQDNLELIWKTAKNDDTNVNDVFKNIRINNV